MSNYDRLKTVIYEFLSFEEVQLEEKVDESYQILIQNGYTPVNVLEHYKNQSKAEEFKVLQWKLYEILAFW